MKKWLKYLLITIAVILGVILEAIIYDTINAAIFKKSPIISTHHVLDGNNYVDKGVLFNVFYCHHSADVVNVSWKFKTTKYACPISSYSKYMFDITDHVFIKTFIINKITKSDENNYQNWLITYTQDENNYTIKVPNKFKVEENTKYQIMFKVTSNNIEENIDSIFNNSEIISVTKTAKDINQLI